MPQAASTVKPEAADWWANFTADSGLTEDRYIKAVEAKPSPAARSVVHHAVESLDQRDGSDGGGTLVEYAVGKNGDIFPEGSGKLMKAGAKIRFNMHYHSVGEAVNDQTSVGIVFYPKGVRAEARDHDDPRAEPGRPRHSGRRRQRAQRRVLQDGEDRAPDRLHAAHAQPRQAPVHRGDLPEHA